MVCIKKSKILDMNVNMIYNISSWMIYISSSRGESCVLTQLSLHLNLSYGTMYRNFFIILCIHLITQQYNDIMYTGDNNVKKRNIRTRSRNNGFRI